MKTGMSPERGCAAPAAAANFNALAQLYRWLELFTFGLSLARCRTAFLSDCASCRRALVLGDGDGRFTAQLLRANPDIEIDAVDASPAMLRILLRRAGGDRRRLRVFAADVRSFRPPDPPYDLIVTHFFLDCLTTEEVGFLAATLSGAVSDRATWIVSDFSVPEGWYGRLVARPAIAFLYLAFGLLTGLAIRKLPDHAAAMTNAGFTLKRRRGRLHDLLISEIWTLDAVRGVEI
jgi:SAM-dependent methyltransferase